MSRYESRLFARQEVDDFFTPAADVEAVPARIPWRPIGNILRLLMDILFLQVLLAVAVWVTDFLVPVSGEVRPLALILLLFPLGGYLWGLYPGYGLPTVERFRRHVHLTFSFFTMAMILTHLLPESRSTLAPLLVMMVLTLTLMPPLQLLVLRHLASCGWWGTPVVVVGATTSGAAVIRSLLSDLSLGLRPVAVLDDDPLAAGKSVEGVAVAGPITDASKFAGVVTYVIVALPETRFEKLSRIIENLSFPHVIILPRIQGLQSLWVDGRDLNGFLGLELKKNIFSEHNLLLKRVMDLVLGVPLFLLSIPVMAVCALAILIVDGRPVFFAQDREGYMGKRLKIYKLRTMCRNSEHVLERHLMENPAAREEWRKYLKLKKDPRILPVIGRFMRKMSLDELPQLWNVVRGELSLIGPRVFAYWHLEKFCDDFRNLRRSVRPGLSGLWQVTARNDGDLEVQEVLDTYYIRNWSIWMDLVLLGRTVWVVLSGKGAY